MQPCLLFNLYGLLATNSKGISWVRPNTNPNQIQPKYPNPDPNFRKSRIRINSNKRHSRLLFSRNIYIKKLDCYIKVRVFRLNLNPIKNPDPDPNFKKNRIRIHPNKRHSPLISLSRFVLKNNIR